MSKPTKTSFPSVQELYQFIVSQKRPISKRDIARSFGITGSDRIPLKAMLKDLVREEKVDRIGGSYHKPERHELVEVEIYGQDENGDFMAKPLKWHENENPPVIYIFTPQKKTSSPVHRLSVGDRAMVSLHELDEFSFEGRVIRKVAQHKTQEIIGQFVATKYGGWLEPSQRDYPKKIPVLASETMDAQTGDLVIADIAQGHGRARGHAAILSVLGRADDPKLYSMISAIEQGLPREFSSEAIALAEKASLPKLGNRTDLRDIPLVTIDGEDARDFDDAVWAQPHPDKPGEWEAIVAIADVAYYVRPGDALDTEAFLRGNSTYFPNEVLPMLPEALSNEMCSLKPNVDRACLAVRMRINEKGQVVKHTFMRGLMRSHARLTYNQVQDAVNGKPHSIPDELMKTTIPSLYGVYKVLSHARKYRGTIELDLPEQQVLFNDEGHIDDVITRDRFDSHRLIEELMIAANVCAAQALEQKQHPVMYRVHDTPDLTKLITIAKVLSEMGMPKTKSMDANHKRINQLLDKSRELSLDQLVSMLVLRSMSQAVYSPNNLGHYGLNLQRYSHFTSPIRRYSDLIIHRSLISAFKLGEGGLEETDFHAVADHISGTERRSMKAERSTLDRLKSLYIGNETNKKYTGNVVSVNSFGLFVEIDKVGATGFLPLRSMADDFYVFHEDTQRLVGRRKRHVIKLGQSIEVEVVNVSPVSGGIELATRGPSKKKKSGKKKKK